MLVLSITVLNLLEGVFLVFSDRLIGDTHTNYVFLHTGDFRGDRLMESINFLLLRFFGGERGGS